MAAWTMYPVFVATVISVIGLTRIARKSHRHDQPRSLSELAASEQSLLKHFRNILASCGVLFAVSVFGYIVPRISYSELVAIFGALMIGGELIASLLPARNKTMLLHTIMAQIMAVGMLGLAVLFCLALDGAYSAIEAIFVLGMSVFAVLTYVDRKRYIFHELAFIFCSHFSILIAALAIA